MSIPMRMLRTGGQYDLETDYKRYRYQMEKATAMTALELPQMEQFFAKYDEYLDHEVVSAAFFRGEKDQLDSPIFARVKQELAGLDKEGIRSLCSMVWAAGEMNC